MLNETDAIISKRKLWILICCFFVCSFFSSLLFSLLQPEASYQLSKLFLALYSVISFLFPVVIVRNLFKQRNSLNEIKSNRTLSVPVVLFSLVAMVSCIVVMNWLNYLNEQLPIWSSFKNAEINAQEKTQLNMQMNSIGHLFYNLLVFAIVPSICEEIFFRGTMQPLWIKNLDRKWLAVLITAAIFSFLHFQFLGSYRGYLLE